MKRRQAGADELTRADLHRRRLDAFRLALPLARGAKRGTLGLGG